MAAYNCNLTCMARSRAALFRGVNVTRTIEAVALADDEDGPLAPFLRLRKSF